jgi:hypothetical protein
MKQVLITTFTLMILPTLLLAQSTYVSSSNVLYRYNDELQREEIGSYEKETQLTIDLTGKTAILVDGNITETYTILTVDEFQLESGIIYKYDIASEDGEVKKLEINTQKKVFIIKPKEIRSGETSRKYSIN